jgi:Rrf2 family protein
MTLSQTAEHALRAVLFLARQPDGVRVPAETIADALDAPRNYMSKTLGLLAREGLITGARGPTGGFRLERSPAELTLAEVVRAFEEPASRSAACLEGGRLCDGNAPCGAHERWTEVRRQARAPMEETVIADLLGDPDGRVRPEEAAA